MQTRGGRGRLFPPLATPGTPGSQEKPLSPPMAAVTPTWAFSCVVKASVQTVHRARSSVSSGEHMTEPWRLLVLKSGLSSNFIFLQDTWVGLMKVPLKHPEGTFLPYRELSGGVSRTAQVYPRDWLRHRTSEVRCG